MSFTMSGVEGGWDFNRFDVLSEGKDKKKCDKCKGKGCSHCKGTGYHVDRDDDEDENEGVEGVSEDYDPMDDDDFDPIEAEQNRGVSGKNNPKGGKKTSLKKLAKSIKKEEVELEEGLDPVGKEDGDVDNDGDKDSSDKYLLKRRKAIAKAMKKEEAELESFTEKELDLLEELLGKSEALDEGIGAVVAGAAKALGGAAKAGAKTAAKGAATSVAKKALQPKQEEEEEEVEESYKPVPFEKMERQAGKAYKKEQEAVRKGDEEEANKQMKRRVAMKSPLGRRQELMKKNARSKPMGESYNDVYDSTVGEND